MPTGPKDSPRLILHQHAQSFVDKVMLEMKRQNPHLEITTDLENHLKESLKNDLIRDNLHQDSFLDKLQGDPNAKKYKLKFFRAAADEMNNHPILRHAPDTEAFRNNLDKVLLFEFVFDNAKTFKEEALKEDLKQGLIDENQFEASLNDFDDLHARLILEYSGDNPHLEQYLNQVSGFMGLDDHQLRGFYIDLSTKLKEDESLGYHPQSEAFLNTVQNRLDPEPEQKKTWSGPGRNPYKPY